MTRVILAPNDLLTLFDLRAQNFRVNVEFSTCHRGQKFFSKKCPKVTFRLEKKFLLSFFETAHFGSLVVEKISKTFFSSRRVPFGQFFLMIYVAKMGIKRLHFDQKSPWTFLKILSKNGLLVKSSRCLKWKIFIVP